MSAPCLIESIFDKVLVDKEKSILNINIEDIINETEMVNVNPDAEITLRCKSMDEEEFTNDLSGCNQPTSVDPIKDVEKVEELIEEKKESEQRSAFSFIRKLFSCGNKI
jgi:uncharacterized sporulation protein YeaH/YhbH (DUF444 family)